MTIGHCGSPRLRLFYCAPEFVHGSPGTLIVRKESEAEDTQILDRSFEWVTILMPIADSMRSE
jgi:hypothetical protein